MDIKKLGRATKTKNGFLGLLLLACFAGNADANALNAKVRNQIDNVIRHNRTLNYQSINTILALLQNEPIRDYFTQQCANNGKLRGLIDSLVRTINNGGEDAAKAADAFRSIIFSSANDAARDNIFNHSSIHFKNGRVNTVNDFNALGKQKHTVLRNYVAADVFSDVIGCLDANGNRIYFTPGGQVRINIPLQNIFMYQPEIVDFEKVGHRSYKDEYKNRAATRNYSIQCYINIGNDGLIIPPAVAGVVNGKSGSCYPQRDN